MADELVTDDAQQDAPVDHAPSTDFAGAGADEPGLSTPSLASLLRDRQFEIDDDATDDDVIARFEELETAAEERERLKQEVEQYKAWYAQQQQQPAPPQPEKAEEKTEPEKPKAPEVPEWDEAWEGWLTQDDRGNIVVRQELRGAVDPSLPQKYMTYKKWERDRLRTLLKQDATFDPTSLDGKFKEVEERAYKRALEEFEKKQQQTATLSYLEKYEQDNASWLNADTQLRNLLSDRVSQFIERGFSPQDAVKYAQFDVEQQTGKAPWKQSDEAEPEQTPTPTQKKVALRKRKNNGTNRLPQEPVKRAKPSEEIIERPTARNLQDSWANQLKQAAGIES